jgi:hypothetical protein
VEEVAEVEEVAVEDAERRVSLVVTRLHQPNNSHPLEDTSREATSRAVSKAVRFLEEVMVVTNHLSRFPIRKRDSTT